MINFIDEHNILYKFQFAFHTSQSTSHAIMYLAEKVYSALDSGNILIGVFMDLRSV